MQKTFTIWCNNLFVPLEGSDKEFLKNSLSGHKFYLFDSQENGREGESADILKKADIAFGSPDPQAVLQAENLGWVHLNTAGYTAYDHADIKNGLKDRGIILTNSSSVYAEPCAQHLLAMMMSITRGIPQSLDAQRGDKDWRMSEIRPTLPLLNDQTAILLGFGAIALRIVELLQPFGMNLIGYRRHVKGNEPIKMVTEADLDEVLPLADHLVNILPASESTDNFFNDERFSKLKKGAVLYNIGRGTTIDQSALIKSLESNQLRAAFLDVTNPEPLPPDNPLWTTPNCYITPHTAGGHATEKERQIGHFLGNLERFEQGKPMIDWIV